MNRPLFFAFMILALMVPARGDEKLKPAGSKGTDAACETCCCGDEGQPHRVFELRTYYLNDGKLDDLHKRFRDHTCGLLKKHGAELIGFWTPADPKDGKNDKLIYLVAFPSREAARKTWDAFSKDPEWQRVYKASHQNGVLVKKVESVFMDPTDYSAMK
jgi:hypothetical protein